MKRLILSLIFLAPFILLAQSPIQVSSPYQYNKYVKVLDSLVSKNVIIPRVAAFPTPKQTGQIVNKQDTVCFWNGSIWVRIRRVTWPEDSVRYASKSGVAADTIKLHNQIITKLAINDTTKLHNQIATKQPQLSGTGFVKATGTSITYDNTNYQPAGSYLTTETYVGDSSEIKEDIRYLKALTDTTSELVAKTIYVSQYLGNDTTGDGLTNATAFRSLGKAFKSTKNIIRASLIFQLDSGNYVVSEQDYITINEKTISSTQLFNQGASDVPIIIQGNIKLISTITGTRDSNNPFKYNCTGVTWNTDQWEGYFVYHTTSQAYYPIESNISNQLTAASSSGTFSGIYQLKTTLTVYAKEAGIGPGLAAIHPKTNNGGGYMVSFRKLIFSLQNGGNYLISSRNSSAPFSYQIESCSWVANINKIALLAATGAVLDIVACFFKTSGTGTTNSLIQNTCSSNTQFRFSVMKTTTSSTCRALNLLNYTSGSMNQSIFSGFYSIYSNVDKEFLLIGNVFYKNCTNILSSFDNRNLFFSEDFKQYFENCTNLLNIVAYPRILYVRFVNTIIGISNIFNPASLASYKNKYYIPEQNYFLTIPNTYSEFQQNKLTTLTNNSTDSISIADLSYNRSINIDYTITRNGQYRKGSMSVLNTGSTYLFDPGDYIESADVGVTFQGVYKSGNSNILKLKWTTTNTGQNATIQCDYRRQNF